MIEIQDIKASISSGRLIQDSFLKDACFIRNNRNTLAAYTGGFTVVFPCYANNEKWAFRCWHTTLDGSHERFKLLSSSLKSLDLPYFTDFVYVDAGIIVNGQIYPTTRMKWIEGDNLKTFVWNHRNDRASLLKLGLDFLTMTQKLHSMSIAHGDLQHANIIVDNNGNLHLIDYDSMFVPELKTINAKDIISGKPEYQHPARNGNVYANEKLDYFSEAIILCGILAIAYKPELAVKFNINDPDAVLFTRNDFDNFSSSTIYHDLSGLPKCVLLLRDVIERYLAEDDINKLAPIDATVQPITSSSASFEQYVNESEIEYQNVLREQEKRREQERIAEQKRKDNLAWATACRWNTEASYLVYLRNYPNGIHSGEVKSRLDKIREERKEADEQSWKKSCLINTSSAYDKYIKVFPTGMHVTEAKRRRDECKDCEDWAEATKTNTERSITSYLANHLSGKFAENARLWLKRYKEEEEKWKRAQSYGTIEAYKSYLSRYPNGKYRKQAKELIEKEQDKIRQNCFTAGIVALGLSCIILIPLGIIKCESVNSDYSTPPPPVVYQQQLTPEEINSITTKLDKKIKGLEQAKKDGISRNQTLLNDASNLLEQLNGTAEYEKYKARLKKVQN